MSSPVPVLDAADWQALLPLAIVAGAAAAAMLAIAVRRRHAPAALVCAAGLAAALVSVPAAAQASPRRVTALLAVDGHALAYMAVLLATALAVALLAHGYLARRDDPPEEFYPLLLLATLGGMLLAAGVHLAALFLGLEILSVSLYALIGYPAASRNAAEAAIKYLVLAGSSSAILVFGMALLYAASGTMELEALLAADAPARPLPLMAAGMALVMAGAGFKLAWVPFHQWAPDVYQGAPAPAAAAVATLSKAAVVALAARLLAPAGDAAWMGALGRALAAVAAASMLAGGLLALRQTRLKRILAYSSVSHMGFVAIALLTPGPAGAEAAAFYVAAYCVTTAAAFGVIGLLSAGPDDEDSLDALRGLLWRRPAAAGVLVASLLSLAGLPLTAGFVAKFQILMAGAEASLWALCAALVAGSVLGLVYYLRVIAAMAAPAEAEPRGARQPVPAATAAALGLLTLLVVGLGVWPAPLQRLAEAALAGR
ncbi:MAG TPA: NADH-quinone oxidoreductase subunit N [Candidatus Polarisedimenticolia bacterium]|nr:NADH-quinone oxidoreductase subunit N [Candidatus Polarisedimenticolia bacterium]